MKQDAKISNWTWCSARIANTDLRGPQVNGSRGGRRCTMAHQLDPAVAALLAQHAPHLALTPDGAKVQCLLNGHTLPARLDALVAFVG
jgi:hypothetical protein